MQIDNDNAKDIIRFVRWYICKGCSGLLRLAMRTGSVDDLVQEVIVRLLSQPDVACAWTTAAANQTRWVASRLWVTRKRHIFNEYDLARHPVPLPKELQEVPPDWRMHREELHAKIAAIAAGRIPSRAWQVVKWRYGLTDAGELTQKECGERLGISASGVSRLERQAMRKLQDARYMLLEVSSDPDGLR